METRIPNRIENCPLIDALIELRFDPQIDKSAVFGVIYNAVKDEYRGSVERLPVLQLPESVREIDPNLKYKPLYRLSNDQFILQIGSDVVSVSSKMPYVGWSTFSKHTLSLLKRIEETGVVKRFVRLGHRYINFFEQPIENRLTMSFRMTEGFESRNLTIRTEVSDGDYVNTLQFLSNAKYCHPLDGERRGSVIDIDTFREYVNDSFMQHMESEIDGAHKSEKKLFFSLLNQDLLSTLNPQYINE